MTKRYLTLTLLLLSSIGLYGCPAPPPPAVEDQAGEGNVSVNTEAEPDAIAEPETTDTPVATPSQTPVGNSSDNLPDETEPDSEPETEPEPTFDEAFSGDAQRLSPYRDTLTEDEAWHLLRRAAFGATPQQVQQAVDQGLTATVNDLLTLKPVPQEILNLALTMDDDPAERWLVYLIESPNPLFERMALFWHDRFATAKRAASQFRERNLPYTHMDLLRAYALGNYRQFLLQLTLDPLMLLWLDGANSPKDSPNENYTREFWELFTLGRDALYTEQDIIEGSRAFTGISLLYPADGDPRPIFDIFNHDETFKTVFPDRASAQNHDYITITDLTLAQPEAARYVARNLFVAFVHDEPTDEVVQELADLFVAGNFEIAPLVRKLLMSQALFSSAAHGNQITSPVEHVVGVFRTLDMHIHSEDSQTYRVRRIADYLADAGMEMMNPPGVEGWTEGTAWLEDQWVLSRARAFNYYMEFGPSRTEDLPYHLLPSDATWDEPESRKAIVRAMAKAFHLELTPEEEDIYVLVLDQDGYAGLHTINPDSRYRHIQEMIRLMSMDERVLVR
jgi:uncharacterized protein (DUF1800 family)